MSKRARMEMGVDRRRIAAAIGARMNAKWPYSKYGRSYTERGTESSLAMFGPTWKDASAEQRVNRKTLGYVGRGKYIGRGGFFRDLGKWAGRGIGGLFGSKDIGGKIGGGLGGIAEELTGRGLYTGRGAYSTDEQANEVMAGSNRTSATFHSVPDETGSVIVSNREYVGDIFAPAISGSFDLQSFPLNPGLEQTFPWLAQTAANYEEYEFIQCVFEFKSTVQDVNSSNGQVGTIICATNYNASQPLFTDKPAMISYYGSVSGKSTDNLVAGVECDPKKLSGTVGSYVRTNPVLLGEDLKTYDHGIFQLATHNIPQGMLNGTLGELYVVYTVKLRKPRFLTGRGLAISRYLQVSGGGETTSFPMGSSSEYLFGQQNNLAVKFQALANQMKLTFPAYFSGSLEVKLNFEGNTISYGVFNEPTVQGNVVASKDIYATVKDNTDTPWWYTYAQTAAGFVMIIHVKVSTATNGSDNVLVINTNIIVGNMGQCQLDISEYNTSFNDRTSGAPVLVKSSGVVVVP